MALQNNKWDCPECTYLNWSSSVKCTLCGCGRSDEAPPKATVAKIKSYTQNSLSTTKLSTHDKSSSPSEFHRPWTCSVCTYSNAGRTSVCCMCQSTRSSEDVHHQSRRSPLIRDYAVSSSSSVARGAVGGVSSDTITDHNVKKHHKQRHSSKRWRCVECTYENYLKSTRCTMCGITRQGAGPYIATPRDLSIPSQRRDTSDEMRQIRNRLSMNDWLYLRACEGVAKGDGSVVKDYLKGGGDKLRQLTSKEVQLLGGQSPGVTTGSSLVDLALRYHQSDILSCLLTPAPLEAHKRLPSQTSLDIAALIRDEVHSSICQREGNFPCYYTTNVATFVLPKELNTFCECTCQKIRDQVVDIDVLKVLEKENRVINWSTELMTDLHCKLYPLWNRTAGDCLLDSAHQSTCGVSDRDSVLRKTLADSLNECSSQFYNCWRDAELSTAKSQGFRLDESQLKTEWTSIVSSTDHKGRSLDQIHVFVLAHVLRRPIIVYGVRIVENYRGEKLGPVNYEGVYLPLLWESSFCSDDPIALAYTRGHFSALVSIATDDMSCDSHVTYLPLVDCDGVQLPIHFISDQQVGREDKLLKEYCDCYVTRSGLMTARQSTEHLSHNVTDMIQIWLEQFYQLNKKCKNCV